jgi:hypothetical protein
MPERTTLVLEEEKERIKAEIRAVKEKAEIKRCRGLCRNCGLPKTMCVCMDIAMGLCKAYVNEYASDSSKKFFKKGLCTGDD